MKARKERRRGEEEARRAASAALQATVGGEDAEALQACACLYVGTKHLLDMHAGGGISYRVG